jgi:hypothetical protein
MKTRPQDTSNNPSLKTHQNRHSTRSHSRTDTMPNATYCMAYMHHNNPADEHTAATPYGGAARPAPDKGAGTTTLTSTQRSSTPPSALRGRAPALAGRVTATQCGSGPLGTGAAGGVPPPPPSTKLKPPALAGSRPSAAESGRAADRELSGVWTEFEALATRHHDPGPQGNRFTPSAYAVASR